MIYTNFLSCQNTIYNQNHITILRHLFTKLWRDNNLFHIPWLQLINLSFVSLLWLLAGQAGELYPFTTSLLSCLHIEVILSQRASSLFWFSFLSWYLSGIISFLAWTLVCASSLTCFMLFFWVISSVVVL